MAKKIKIDKIKVNGVTIKKGSVGDDLLELYFEKEKVDTDTFRLHDPDGNEIKTEPTDLKKGTDFHFPYAGREWFISDFDISEKHGHAKGSWTPGGEIPPPADGDPESGTFQAQAGPGVPVGKRASASARA